VSGADLPQRGTPAQPCVALFYDLREGLLVTPLSTDEEAAAAWDGAREDWMGPAAEVRPFLTKLENGRRPAALRQKSFWVIGGKAPRQGQPLAADRFEGE
jgi:hypothetical protein